MVNDNTSNGITFDRIYRIETDIISDVTDEENMKETEAARKPSDEEMVASCEAIEKSDKDLRFKTAISDNDIRQLQSKTYVCIIMH